MLVRNVVEAREGVLVEAIEREGSGEILLNLLYGTMQRWSFQMPIVPT